MRDKLHCYIELKVVLDVVRTCMLRATLDLLCSALFDLILQSVSLWAESNQLHALFCLSAGFAGVCCVLRASCALHGLSRYYLQSLRVTRVWRNFVSISATEDHEACCESIIDVKSALCVSQRQAGQNHSEIEFLNPVSELNLMCNFKSKSLATFLCDAAYTVPPKYCRRVQIYSSM